MIMFFVDEFDCKPPHVESGTAASSARQAVVATLAVHHDDAAQRAPQPATETLHAGGIAAAAITN